MPYFFVEDLGHIQCSEEMSSVLVCRLATSAPVVYYRSSLIQSQSILHDNHRIVYRGSWVSVLVNDTIQDPPVSHQSHAAGKPGSSMFVSFKGKLSGAFP